MRKRKLSPIVLWIVLSPLGVSRLAAQHQHEHQQSQPQSRHQHQQQQQKQAPAGERKEGGIDQQGVSQTPHPMQRAHRLLAAAYAQNLGVFAKALQTYANSTASLDHEFLFTVVAEMNRSFDTMQQHLQEYQKTLGATAAAKNPMTQSSEAQMAEVRQHLLALGRDLEYGNLVAAKTAKHGTAIFRLAYEISAQSQTQEHGSH